jgi:energy-coupling factor transporter ATP-binding protein EcfA2
MPALNGINLIIEEGAFVGIIGPNGSGKTTLAYSLDGLIPSQYRGIKQGAVNILGREVEAYPAGALQKLVGVVFSDPEAQFTAMTVEDELVFGMENLGLSVPEIRERLEWVTELAELGHLLEKPPYEISGGQKQRVALAAVSRKRVFDVLVRLKEEQRNTIIVIEHNLENLASLADRMILLSNGELLLEDETHAFFEKMDLLLENGIHPPGAMLFIHRLMQEGYYASRLPLTVDEAADSLTEVLARLKQPGSASSRE